MKTHDIRVYRAPGTTTIPQIRVQGKWIEKAGFHIGDSIHVEAGNGKIRISLVRNEYTSDNTSNRPFAD